MAKAARLMLGALLLSSVASGEPKRSTTCVANNHPFDEQHYDKQTGKIISIEHEDWHVTCTVKQGQRVVWTGELVFAHPAELREALDELRRWMKEAGRDKKVDVPQPQGKLSDAGRGAAGDAPEVRESAQPPG